MSKQEILISLEEFVEKVNTLEPLASIFFVGSFASGTSTRGNDIDLLVIIDTTLKEQLISKLIQISLEEFLGFKRKLDCKIVSKRELSQSGAINYLMLTSMFQNAQHLKGPEIVHTFSPHRLREALIKLKEQLNDLNYDISQGRNYNITAVSLFSITKSYFFLYKIIEPQTLQELRKILGKDFFTLARIYEKYTVKGIQASLALTLIKRGQKSGNFSILSHVYTCLLSFEQEVTEKFYQWYKKQPYS